MRAQTKQHRASEARDSRARPCERESHSSTLCARTTPATEPASFRKHRHQNVAIRSDGVLKVWEISSSSATNLEDSVALLKVKLSNRPTADSSRKPEDPFE